MIPLIIVRPEPGANSTLKAARALGLDAHACPLFEIRPVPWTPVPRGEVDAVVFGSANALRHGGSGLNELRGLPAYCVGQTTATVAQAAGFPVAHLGTGGLQNVLSALQPAHRRLLRLAGVAHVPLYLPAGVTMKTRCVYDSAALPLGAELRHMLRRPAVIMLHSGEAAAHFDALCTRAAIDRARLSLAVIGPRVEKMAGEGWQSVRCAARPSDAELLALAAEMCQDADEAS